MTLHQEINTASSPQGRRWTLDLELLLATVTGAVCDGGHSNYDEHTPKPGENKIVKFQFVCPSVFFL